MRNLKSNRSQRNKAAKTTKRPQKSKNYGTKRSLFGFLISIVGFPFSLIGDMIVHRPKQAFIAALLGGGAVSIILNAVIFQNVPHPAPFFIESSSKPIVQATSQTIRQAPLQRLQQQPPLPVQQARVTEAVIEINNPPDYVFAPPSVLNQPQINADGFLEVAAVERGIEDRDIPLPPIRTIPVVVTPSVNTTAPQSSGLSVGNNDSTQQIKEAQAALVMLGYGQISIDGLLGPGTKRAIEAFERDKGLPVTGAINTKTFKALSSAVRG